MQEQDVRKEKAISKFRGGGDGGGTILNFHFGSLQGRKEGLKERTVMFLGLTLRELNLKLYEKNVNFVN